MTSPLQALPDPMDRLQVLLYRTVSTILLAVAVYFAKSTHSDFEKMKDNVVTILIENRGLSTQVEANTNAIKELTKSKK